MSCLVARWSAGRKLVECDEVSSKSFVPIHILLQSGGMLECWEETLVECDEVSSKSLCVSLPYTFFCSVVSGGTLECWEDTPVECDEVSSKPFVPSTASAVSCLVACSGDGRTLL